AINRSNVLNTIKTKGSISRIEIARSTGLSAATVTGITADLIADGFVYEKEEGDSRGGRRPILLAINPRGGYVVGIKLMEDHAIGAITDLEATIVAKYSSKLKDKSLDTGIESLVEVVNVLMGEGGIVSEQLLGVGVGLAGIVNAKKGVLRYSPYFGWHDVPLVEILRSRLKVPVHIDNDVNTLTLNEQLFGTGQGKENFLTVTIGRGVGLGIVVNGQIYRGGNGAGGEFGHTIIDPEGHQCDCGKKGCLETYVSDPALLRLASEAASRGELPEEPRNVDELIAYAKSGVSVAQSIIAQGGVTLGYGIANLINIFNPQEVIISGEGVRAGELMFEPMRATISQYVMPGLAEDTDICIDVWEDDAWARGAASLVLQELFKSPIYKGKKE
ncbi:MAG: ROK family transcriptional regulator, partial [Anaerolineales bacterium]|nr:ROK family transcriptional regulator [Anaerolineales bacterium]